jgi:hypothetical protein
VLGNLQRIAIPEAVSLHVVKPGSAPITDSLLADALARALGWLATLRIHVIYINGETGQSWRSQDGIPMPSWLAVHETPRPQELEQPAGSLVDRLDTVNIEAATHRYLFDYSVGCYEFEGDHGEKFAYAEWRRDHWQVIEIGLLLRGAGYDAVKVLYTGDTKLKVGGQGVERRIRNELRERLGVVLDWGVDV